MSGQDVLAHGVGGAQDLPLPPGLAIAGAAAALTVSFIVLSLAWRSPRYVGTRGRPAPPGLARLVDSAGFAVVTRGLGFAVFGWALYAAIFGRDLVINPFFGMVYVLLWVGIVPMSLVFGPFYRAVSPVRTINLLFAKLSGADPDEGVLRYPEWLGCWPAAAGLYAFVWMELVYPNAQQLGPLRLWFAIYVAVMLVGGGLFGTRFYERADPFEVYSTLVGHLSFWGREPDEPGQPEDRGRLMVRTPMANLARISPSPGMVAAMAVLFGSTAYDSFSDSNVWIQFIQTTEQPPLLLNNLLLLAFCATAGLLFAGATAATGVDAGTRRRTLPRLFAHSMVPIIVGYMTAHYLSYLVEEGQRTLILMSDPLSQGDDFFFLGGRDVNFWISENPTFLAVVKVLAVVLGHVLGVIAAHDRALQLLPERHQLNGQLPLLVVMVGFTVSGLYLLLSA